LGWFTIKFDLSDFLSSKFDFPGDRSNQLLKFTFSKHLYLILTTVTYQVQLLHF